MTKKAIIAGALLLWAWAAEAQFYYQLTKVGTTGTNETVAATSETNYQSAAGVQLSSWAQLQVSFTLAETNATGTSNLVLVVDRSVDNLNWRDTQSLTTAANATNYVCELFDVPVTNAAYLRLYSVTNANPWTVTNLVVEIGSKPGL